MKPQNLQNLRIISIDGNIASGKSTLLEELKKHFSNDLTITILDEPLAMWESIQDSTGTSIFKHFYQEPQKYAFSFQMAAFIARMKLLREALLNSSNIIITERSIFTDCFVFADMLHKDGLISDIDYEVYLFVFREFCQDFPLYKSIYMCSKPETCHQRVQKRARDGEEVISLEYLTNCSKSHDNLIKKLNELDIEVHVINGETNVMNDENVRNARLQEVVEIINECRPQKKCIRTCSFDEVYCDGL